MGATAWQLKKLITNRFRVADLVITIAAIFLCFLLKPYLLLFFAFCVLSFFVLERYKTRRSKPLLFVAVMGVSILTANIVSLQFKSRSLLGAALEHQKRFEAVSTGGVFLTDSKNYMQLQPDTTLIKRSVQKNRYTIRKGVNYMYWEPGRPADTLYCRDNQDTVSVYEMIYYIPKSGSNIQLNKTSGTTLLLSALYYGLFHPFFFNASGPLQLLASVENLVILLALILSLSGSIKRRKDSFLPLVFLFFALTLCVLIGFSAPNSGAIFRYRGPGMIFILLGALYYLEPVFGQKHSAK